MSKVLKGPIFLLARWTHSNGIQKRKVGKVGEACLSSIRSLLSYMILRLTYFFLLSLYSSVLMSGRENNCLGMHRDRRTNGLVHNIINHTRNLLRLGSASRSPNLPHSITIVPILCPCSYPIRSYPILYTNAPPHSAKLNSKPEAQPNDLTLHLRTDSHLRFNLSTVMTRARYNNSSSNTTPRGPLRGKLT